MCSIDWGLIINSVIALTGVISVCYLYNYVNETRRIRRATEDQLSQLEKNFDAQNFNSNFFQLLNVYYELISNLNCTIAEESYSGKNCLSLLSNNSTNHVMGQLGSEGRKEDETINDYSKRVSEMFISFYKENSETLSHYFRFLYHIIRLVDESKIEDKKMYIDIVKANIAEFEFVLLFFNGLTPNGKKFKVLIDRYGIFENWYKDRSSLEVKYEFEKLYEKSAFGRS